MKKRNFDYKRRMNALRKKHVKTKAAIVTSIVLVTAPAAASPFLTIPGFDTEEVSAATLGEVNLLQSSDVTATENDTNDYALDVKGQALADLEVLGPDRVGVFQFDLSDLPEDVQDQVDLEVNGKAHVKVDLTAFNMDDLPALNDAIGGITGTATGAVSDVLDVVDDLQSSLIPDDLITVEGVDQLSDAVDALNNIDDAIADVLEYEADEDVVVGDNGELKVDFTDGVGNHLETAINDVVVQTLQNVVDAVDNVEIKILDGAEDIPGVGAIIGGLNDSINGALGAVTDLGDAATSLIDDISDGAIDLGNDIGNIQALGNFDVNIPSVTVNVPKTCDIDGDDGEEFDGTVKGAVVSDNDIDLTLLDSIDATDDVKVNVEKDDNCDVDGDGDADGDSDGDADGDSDGDADGDSDGDADGDSDGDADGDSDGDADGDSDGDADGDSDGDADGDSDGDADGDSDGDADGDSDGDADGDSDGDADGDSDGDADGDSDGDADGDSDGDADGDSDGDADGDSDGDADGDMTLDMPIVNNVYAGDTTINGTGEPGSMTTIKDENGHIIGSGKVDKDGNFTIDLDDPLRKGMELEIMQSKENGDGDTVKSDPTYAIVGDSKDHNNGSNHNNGSHSNGNPVTITKNDNNGGNGGNGSSGHMLPNTATSTFNWILGGMVAFFAGIAGLFTGRRKKGATKSK